MPVALPNLYTSPADIYDYLSAEGAQLRLDDHNLATGQTITVTQDAVGGALLLSISPLLYPLIRGSQLVFDGGGMTEGVTAVLTATAQVGAISLAVQPLDDDVNAQAQARDSGVNIVTGLRLVKGCTYGTSQVKLYCCSRYNDSDLVQAWSCNRWATVLGGRWVAKRNGRTAPQGIEDDWEEVKQELMLVRTSGLNIEDIGTRTSGWPFLSNTSVNIGYEIAKTRVESNISEGTPTQYAPFVDWDSLLTLDY